MMGTRVAQQREATGVVVGIAEPSGHRVLAYGTLGLDDKRPMVGRTVFDVGSITKVLTALLLADMAERREVNLDDPAAKCLPGVAIPSRDGRAITLADLATHTSGLPLRPTNLPSKDQADPYAGYTREQLFDFLASYKLPHAPGTAYGYSNVGFGLLGLALAGCAREDFAKLVAERTGGFVTTAPAFDNELKITSGEMPRAALEGRIAGGDAGCAHVQWGGAGAGGGDTGAGESAGVARLGGDARGVCGGGREPAGGIRSGARQHVL